MRRLLALTLCALALAGCSKPRPAAPRASDHIDAMIHQMNGAGAQAVQREMALLEYQATMPLVKWSGLEAELGGPARADAAVRSLMEANERRSSAYAADLPRLLKISDDDRPNGFLGMFDSAKKAVATFMTLGESPHPEGQKSMDSPAGGVTGEMTWTPGHMVMETVTQTSTPELQSTTTMTMSADRCPDANGHVSIDFTMKSSLTKPGSRAGANTAIHATVTETVDDNAIGHADKDYNVHLEEASFDAGRGSFVDVDYYATNRPGVSERARTNRTSSQATARDIFLANALAQFSTMGPGQSLALAEQYWQGGGCVKLEPKVTPGGTHGVKPSTAFNILAPPRSRIDGTPVGGTVRADLTGGGSLTPAGVKRPADAQFAYVAPAEPNKTGAVKLEARSKRGVAVADLSFDTNLAAYLADGGADAFHGSGTICSFSKPFVISGSGVTVNFTPTSDKGGTYDYSGNMSGFAVWGHGVWEVELTESGGVLKGSGPGSVRTPLGVRSGNGSERYTLTPAAPCP